MTRARWRCIAPISPIRSKCYAAWAVSRSQLSVHSRPAPRWGCRCVDGHRQRRGVGGGALLWHTQDWLLYAHTSAEPGHARVLEALRANCSLGTLAKAAAAVAVPLLRAPVCCTTRWRLCRGGCFRQLTCKRLPHLLRLAIPKADRAIRTHDVALSDIGWRRMWASVEGARRRTIVSRRRALRGVRAATRSSDSASLDESRELTR